MERPGRAGVGRETIAAGGANACARAREAALADPDGKSLGASRATAPEPAAAVLPACRRFGDVHIPPSLGRASASPSQRNAMKIAIIGTDPAGLYLACLLKARRPEAWSRSIDTGAPDREAAPPHILINPVKPELKLADAELGARHHGGSEPHARRGHPARWRDGRTAGQAYAMIRAATLATILRERAVALGCRFEAGAEAGRKPSIARRSRGDR